jgi:hypothetical protein
MKKTSVVAALTSVVLAGCGMISEVNFEEHKADPDAHDIMTISATQITEGKIDIARMPPDFSALQSTVQNHASLLGQHDTLLAEVGSRLAATERTVGQHGETLSIHQSRLDEHTTRLDSHDATLATHESLLTSHETTLGGLATRIDTAEANITAHASSLTSHETTLAGLTTRMGSAEGNITAHDTRIATAETNIAGKVSKAGDTITGTLTVKDLIANNMVVAKNIAYSAPLTRQASVPGLAFTPPNAATIRTVDVNSSLTWISTASAASPFLIAPIALPEGAVITGFFARVHDSTATNTIKVVLRRRYTGEFCDESMCSFGETSSELGSASTVGTPYDTTISSPVLSDTVSFNDNGAYFLVYWQNAGASPGVGLYGVVIKYTMTEPW